MNVNTFAQQHRCMCDSVLRTTQEVSAAQAMPCMTGHGTKASNVADSCCLTEHERDLSFVHSFDSQIKSCDSSEAAEFSWDSLSSLAIISSDLTYSIIGKFWSRAA